MVFVESWPVICGDMPVADRDYLSLPFLSADSSAADDGDSQGGGAA